MTITINGTTGISGVDGSSGTPAYQGNDANTGISFGTDIVTINTGGTARVTTDASGNVGIGTASPGIRLNVTGVPGVNSAARSLIFATDTSSFAAGVGGGISFLAKYNTAGTYFEAGNVKGIKENATDGNFAGALVFTTHADGGSPTEGMRINSSGNVGIGTVSPSSKLTVVSTGAAQSIITGTDAGNGYLQFVGAAGVRLGYMGYGDNSSQMYVFNDKNAAVIFGTNSTERARIDSAGQLGVGFTPLPTQGNLQVYKAISGGAPSTSGSTDANQTAAINSATVQLSFGAYANGTGWIQQRAGGNFAVNYNLNLQPNGGNVGIGTATPAGKLHVVGAIIGQYTDNYFGDYSSGAYLDIGHLGTSDVWLDTRSDTLTNVPLQFRTKGTGAFVWTQGASERMRIDSSGNVGIGLTPTGSKLSILKNSPVGFADAQIELLSSAGDVVLSFHAAGATAVCVDHLRGSAGIRCVNLTRTAYAPIEASAFTVPSDYRVKENVTSLAGALNRVAQLSPKRFSYIEGSMSYSDGKIVDGFLAHEAALVVPEAVTGEKDAVNKEGKPIMQGIDQAKFIPLLTAAIQELTARLEALENK